MDDAGRTEETDLARDARDAFARSWLSRGWRLAGFTWSGGMLAALDDGGGYGTNAAKSDAAFKVGKGQHQGFTFKATSFPAGTDMMVSLCTCVRFLCF